MVHTHQYLVILLSQKKYCEKTYEIAKTSGITPLKFNMEPEKKSLEKVIPFGNHHFQVPC